MTRTYRPEIDHLRAIAVLAVVASHLPVKPFRGGFVGVDVFFVISGFLITGIVASEAEKGEFSFARFYERRIRRILPALCAMLAIVCAAAWWLLLPNDYADLGRSVVAIVLFASNVLFWRESGYFDRSALEKPFLHTWSLAVEEQFYLLLPPLVWLVARAARTVDQQRRWLTRTLSLLALASLACSVLTVRSAPNAAFYLPFGRAFELLIGSLLFVARPAPPSNRTIARAALLLALAGILLPILLYTPKTSFPGWAALPPCLGSALFIWAYSGPPIGLAPGLLGRVLTFFGLTSYSLYLWHWPLIVFARTWLQPERDLPGFAKLAVFAAATLAGWLSYRYVEQPIRARAAFSGRRVLFAAGAGGSAILAGFGALALWNGGFPGRLRPEIAALADYARYDYRGPYRAGSCFLMPTASVDDFARQPCLPAKGPGKLVLVWGDSLAAHYVPGLLASAAGQGFTLAQATSAACPPLPGLEQPVLPNCKPLNDLVVRYLAEQKPDLVVLSANWSVYAPALGPRLAADLGKVLDDLDAAGLRVLLLGPSIQYREALPVILTRLSLSGSPPSEAARFLSTDVFGVDSWMRLAFSGRSGLSYVSVLEAMCPGRVCPALAGGVPVEWDPVHLTEAGSHLAAGRLLPSLTTALGQSRRAAVEGADPTGAAASSRVPQAD